MDVAKKLVLKSLEANKFLTKEKWKKKCTYYTEHKYFFNRSEL